MLRAIVANGGGSTPGGSTGQPQWNSLGSFAGMATYTYAGSGINLTGQVASNADTALAIKAKSGQTGDLQKWQTSSGTNGFCISASFALTWGDDSALSRIGAASLALGNGTAGDYTGNLKLTTVTFADGTALNATGNHPITFTAAASSSVAVPASGTLATTSQLTAGSISGLGSLATASSINNANWSGTQLAVANGGTGVTTIAALAQSLLASGYIQPNANFGGL